MTKNSMKFLSSILLTVAVFGAVLGAQNDPILEEFKKTMEAFGGNTTSSSPAFRKSRENWDDYAAKIAQAEVEQDLALKGSRSDLDTCRELYRARASSRDTALDHYLYARILGLSDDLENAYKSFKMALTRDVYFYWAWDGLGVYYLKKELWDDAADAFGRALQLNPNSERSVFGGVQAEIKRRNYSTAITRLQNLIGSLNPSTDRETILRARLNLAEIHRVRGDLAQCMAELNVIIDGGTSETMVYAMRAFCAKKLEQFDVALRDYQKILEMDPKETRYYFEIAAAHRRMGHNADAANAFEKYLEVVRDVPDSQRTQIRVEIERLRKLRPIDDPRNQQLSPTDWINRLLQSTEEKRRREAILVLSRLPVVFENAEQTRKLNKAFLEAMMDTDWLVRAKAVEQVGQRLNHSTEIVTKIWRFLVDDKDARVRAMAHSVLPNWESPMVVPYLMKGIADSDPGVFVQAHNALNKVTLAWVERILPESVTPDDMKRVQGRWNEWYKLNRDAYRKFEPKE